MRRNFSTSPCRLMAIRMLRTVMPSQKHTTTLALGRWAVSLSSNRSKLCSPALLQILPGKMCNAQAKCFTNELYSMVIKCQTFIGKFYNIAGTYIWCTYTIYNNNIALLTRVSNADTLLGCHVFERFHATFTIVTCGKKGETYYLEHVLSIQSSLNEVCYIFSLMTCTGYNNIGVMWQYMYKNRCIK